MDIRNTQELKTFAAQRLEQAQSGKRIVLIYAGLVLGLSVLVSLADYGLELQISQSGGLSNMGVRSILSAVQSVLPILQSAVVMCIELGYLAAMLRIARGQYSSPKTLRLGFDRFWPLLRLSILKGLIYFGIGFLSIYLAAMIYMMTPLSDSVVALLSPLLESSASSGIELDEGAYLQMMSAMSPMLVIFGLIYCVAVTPVLYQYRMADYVLIDRPGQGAVAALRESRKMMRGKRWQLFRVDLGLWWYYAALLGAMVVCYGDQLLPLLGVDFFWSETVSFFLFYALYLALQFAIYYVLRNRVAVTYALAYDSIRPKDQTNNGIVLGNIFQP